MILDKVLRLRETLKSRGLSAQIEVDGGVDASNIRSLLEAGVDAAVAGSAVLGQAHAEGAPEAANRGLPKSQGSPLA